MEFHLNWREILFIWLVSFFFCSTIFSQEIIICSSNGLISRINPEFCSSDSVTHIQTEIFDLAFHPDGILYGVSRFGNLFVIDTLSGNITIVHKFNSGIINGLAISSSGLIFACGISGQIETIDLDSGAINILGSLPGGLSGDLLFINNNLYALLFENRLLKVNLLEINKSILLIEDSSIEPIFGLFSSGSSCAEISSYAVTSENGDIYLIDFISNNFKFECSLLQSVSGATSNIEFTNPFIKSAILQDSECNPPNGSIHLEIENLSDIVEIIINGNSYVPSLEFNDLISGVYNIKIVNSNNCVFEETFIIEQNGCEFYFPNIFSPNNDGINDFFNFFAHENFQGSIDSLLIFDRWGNQILNKVGENTADFTWDGLYFNKPVNEGVYVYVVLVTNSNKTKSIHKGDITLIR